MLVSTVYAPAPVLFNNPFELKSPSINAPAAATLVASVISAPLSGNVAQILPEPATSEEVILPMKFAAETFLYAVPEAEYTGM